MALSARDIVYAAFTELGVKPPDQDLGAEAAAWGFDKLNRLVDKWATKRLYIYVITQLAYTFGTSKQSYTIGPTGADFTAPRPVRIDSATIVLVQGQAPYTEIPLPLIDTDEYAALRVPGLSSTIPTKLYYQPTFPNGTLFPWPYPTTVSNQLRLWVWGQISQFATLDTAFALPPGYWDAIVFSLAESMLPTYPSEAAAPAIIGMAADGRKAIAGVNALMPLIVSNDGLPYSGAQTPSFSWKTGDFVTPRR